MYSYERKYGRALEQERERTSVVEAGFSIGLSSVTSLASPFAGFAVLFCFFFNRFSCPLDLFDVETVAPFCCAGVGRAEVDDEAAVAMLRPLSVSAVCGEMDAAEWTIAGAIGESERIEVEVSATQRPRFATRP